MGEQIFDSQVHRLLEAFVPLSGGHHFGSHHLHAEDIETLSFDVLFAHINDAFHAHERGRGCRGHAVLSRAGFRDDALLAHAPGEQNLS